MWVFSTPYMLLLAWECEYIPVFPFSSFLNLVLSVLIADSKFTPRDPVLVCMDGLPAAEKGI